MLVTVQLDLANDSKVLEMAQNNNSIIGLLHIYDAIGDEKYLFDVGKKLWKISNYAKEVWELCEGDIFDFYQSTAWIYEFKTSQETAIIFITGFSASKIAKVIYPVAAKQSDLIQ